MVHHLSEVMTEHNARANLNDGKRRIIIIMSMTILAVVIKDKKKCLLTDMAMTADKNKEYDKK